MRCLRPKETKYVPLNAFVRPRSARRVMVGSLGPVTRTMWPWAIDAHTQNLHFRLSLCSLVLSPVAVHLPSRAEGGWNQGEGATGAAAPTVINCVLIHLYLMVPHPHPAAQVLLAHWPRWLLIIVIVTAFFTT